MSDSAHRRDTERSDALLARLGALHPKKIDLSLGRMYRLLDALGNPEKRLPPVIHVAGTNGKGSTVAIMRAIAEAAGLRVHVYSSPHLVRFHERIRLGGQLISEDRLLDVLGACEKANAGAEITFFELTTAAAFLAFAEAPADLCILEVGLGGRLDATNVIPNPVMSVITPVSLDHKEFLGSTVAAIAAEKAGIIKSGCPVVIGPQTANAESTIRKAAKVLDAPAYFYGKEWHVRTRDKNQIQLGFEGKTISLPRPPLEGSHQAINAAVAVQALRVQRAVKISESAMRAGLGWVRWPARLQSLASSTLMQKLPKGAELWLDGGHNPAAGRAMQAFLQRFDPVDQPISLIIAMQSNKDIAGYLKPLRSAVGQVIAVPLPNSDSGFQPSDIAAEASELGLRGLLAKDVLSALERITAEASETRPPIVVISGSLYLAGHVLDMADMLPT